MNACDIIAYYFFYSTVGSAGSCGVSWHFPLHTPQPELSPEQFPLHTPQPLILIASVVPPLSSDKSNSSTSKDFNVLCSNCPLIF